MSITDEARAKVAGVLDPLPDDARMDAYYYGFERTGVGAVDAILSAVAVAGKGLHSTEDWGDDDQSDYWGHPRPGLPSGQPSAEALIQAAAEQSAAAIREALRAGMEHAWGEGYEWADSYVPDDDAPRSFWDNPYRSDEGEGDDTP